MYLRDFGWFLLKDNLFVNVLYYFAYKIFIKNKQNKYNLSKNSNFAEMHPAYKNFDFSQETSKQFVIEHAEEFKQNKGIAFKGYTSGTSNTPLVVYRSIPSVIFDELSLRAHWYSVGVGFNPKTATLRGDNLFPGDYNGDVYWKKMPFTSRLIMSSFHLNPTTISSYLDELEKFKPDIILAYPSSIISLARLAKEKNWKPNWDLKGVFTSGESFTEKDQAEVREVFSNTFDHYGQAERVCRIQQCKAGKYHFVDWYTDIELVEDESGFKRVIGTNFRNAAMPLYRYNTGDLVDDSNCDIECGCGNKAPYVNSVLGRIGGELKLPNGTTISSPALSLLFYGIENIAEGQIVQKVNGNIEVRYSSIDGTPDSAVEASLMQNFTNRLGKSIDISIVHYIKIPRTKSGKLLPLVVEKQ